MYTYQPLLRHDEVRVVFLHPEIISPDGSIHLTLSIYQLEHAPPYEALSYAWGDQNEPIRITANGLTMHIGQNLHKSLTKLRRKEKIRTLWVDAICINQNDIPEKSRQVSQMKEIFAKARMTTMWIGKEHGDDGMLDTYTIFGHLIPTAMNWPLQKTYFSRSWITQEVVVSKHPIVVCRSFRISFDTPLHQFAIITSLQRIGMDQAIGLVRLGHWSMLSRKDLKNEDLKNEDIEDAGKDDENQEIDNEEEDDEWQGFDDDPGNKEDMEDEDIGDENDSGDDIKSRDRELSLINLLVEERDKVAKNPLDKVYALLGFARLSENVHFDPDYSKSVEEVYITVARQFIQRDDCGLRILSYSQPGYSTRKLPSWVPDWSKPWHGSIETRINFRASRSLEPFVCVNISLNNIILRGFRVDSIKKIGGTSSSDWKPNPWLPVPIATKALAETTRLGLHGDYPFTDESYSQAFLEVITAGRGRPVYAHSTFRFHHVSARSDFEINPFNPVVMQWNELIAKLVWSDGEWDVFQSQKGYLGLGPTSMQPGDIFCVFGGADVPFILRPWKGHGYRLVGECYIHGIMNGEATQGMSTDQLEEFVLY